MTGYFVLKWYQELAEISPSLLIPNTTATKTIAKAQLFL